MILGAHMVVYTTDAAADRAFFRDVLAFPHVDAGDGWLIFKMPAAETAFHPAHENGGHELYLMTENVDGAVATLRGKGVVCDDIQQVGWGALTRFTLPGGGRIGLYQPRHPTAF